MPSNLEHDVNKEDTTKKVNLPNALYRTDEIVS